MKIIITILILLPIVCCFGQGRHNKKMTKQMAISEIRKLFPYNKTANIKLVSFKDATEEILVDESRIPKTNGQLDMTRMFEVKSLDDAEANELMLILVNYDHQETNAVAFCYEPRNGVVFFDSDQHVIGYIEICFECLRYIAEPGTITISTLFPDEFEKIRSLFRRKGINHGTGESRD